MIVEKFGIYLPARSFKSGDAVVLAVPEGRFHAMLHILCSLQDRLDLKLYVATLTTCSGERHGKMPILSGVLLIRWDFPAGWVLPMSLQ